MKIKKKEKLNQRKEKKNEIETITHFKLNSLKLWQGFKNEIRNK